MSNIDNIPNPDEVFIIENKPTYKIHERYNHLEKNFSKDAETRFKDIKGLFEEFLDELGEGNLFVSNPNTKYSTNFQGFLMEYIVPKFIEKTSDRQIRPEGVANIIFSIFANLAKESVGFTIGGIRPKDDRGAIRDMFTLSSKNYQLLLRILLPGEDLDQFRRAVYTSIKFDESNISFSNLDRLEEAADQF